MNKPLRRLAAAVMVLFGLLLINANYIQVVRAKALHNDPSNPRLIQEEYSRKRRLCQQQPVWQRLVAEQQLLRQGRSVVRRQRLVADQQDAAVEPVAAQGADAAHGGHTPTHDQDVDARRQCGAGCEIVHSGSSVGDTPRTTVVRRRATLAGPMQLRLATPDDLPHVRALRDAAGWKTQPWAVLEAMRAPHARLFLAEDAGGVAGMGSGISYGRLGVVGNMVVVASRRREGIGSTILRAVLAFLEERGVERMELFATADGRPLYERHGFTGLEPGMLAEIPAHPGRSAEPERETVVRAAQPVDLGALAAYDGPRFGGDRSPLLRGCARRSGARPDPRRARTQSSSVTRLRATEGRASARGSPTTPTRRSACCARRSTRGRRTATLPCSPWPRPRTRRVERGWSRSVRSCPARTAACRAARPFRAVSRRCTATRWVRWADAH